VESSAGKTAHSAVQTLESQAETRSTQVVTQGHNAAPTKAWIWHYHIDGNGWSCEGADILGQRCSDGTLFVVFAAALCLRFVSVRVFNTCVMLRRVSNDCWFSG